VRLEPVRALMFRKKEYVGGEKKSRLLAVNSIKRGPRCFPGRKRGNDRFAIHTGEITSGQSGGGRKGGKSLHRAFITGVDLGKGRKRTKKPGEKEHDHASCQGISAASLWGSLYSAPEERKKWGSTETKRDEGKSPALPSKS